MHPQMTLMTRKLALFTIVFALSVAALSAAASAATVTVGIGDQARPPSPTGTSRRSA